ncbi:hypothetical protein, partial [uncultured Thomasclavelia sp.]|uniref:hypothetical protein n=1 Tax=uncultured Thomasclavelia sp. TaxID=3025759 RepID=UPI00280BF3E8
SLRKIKKIIWKNIVKIFKCDFTTKFKISIVICFISPRLYFFDFSVSIYEGKEILWINGQQ